MSEFLNAMWYFQKNFWYLIDARRGTDLEKRK